MLAALSRTAREQFTPRHLLGVAALLGALAALGVPDDTLLGVAVGVVVVEVTTVFRDTPGIDQRYVRGAVGAALLLGSAGLAALVVSGGPGELWLPALTGAFGAWLVADAVAAVRNGTRRASPAEEDPSASEVLLVMHHANLLAEELGEGPRTVTELASACDLTESRVEEALSHLEEAGVVATRGERYALVEENTGPVAFVRTAAAGVARRAIRPFARL